MLGFFKSKVNRQAVRNEYLDTLREREAAFCRIQANQAEPSDFMLLAGTEYQAAESQHRDRLGGVAARRDKAGTADNWKSANAKLEERRPVVAAIVEKNSAEIERLQSQVNRLRDEMQTAAGELNTIQLSVDGMAEARDRLRSEAMLPPILVQEVKSLRAAAMAKAGNEAAIKRLNTHIRELENVGGGSPTYAAACKAHPDKAGYEFWKHNDFGPGMASAFEEWTKERLPELRQQLAREEARWDPALIAQIDELKNFYLADLI